MRSFQTPTLPVITLPTVTVTLTAAGNDPRSQVSLKTGENSTLSGLVRAFGIFSVLCGGGGPHSSAQADPSL